MEGRSVGVKNWVVSFWNGPCLKSLVKNLMFYLDYQSHYTDRILQWYVLFQDSVQSLMPGQVPRTRRRQLQEVEGAHGQFQRGWVPPSKLRAAHGHALYPICHRKQIGFERRHTLLRESEAGSPREEQFDVPRLCLRGMQQEMGVELAEQGRLVDLPTMQAVYAESGSEVSVSAQSLCPTANINDRYWLNFQINDNTKSTWIYAFNGASTRLLQATPADMWVWKNGSVCTCTFFMYGGTDSAQKEMRKVYQSTMEAPNDYWWLITIQAQKKKHPTVSRVSAQRMKLTSVVQGPHWMDRDQL
jgi:hypothetical protein